MVQSNSIVTPRPKWVLTLCLLFLLWNIMGLASFITEWMMTPADIAKLPTAQQELWGNMGALSWAAFAIAVGAGTLGALALLLGRKMAGPLFVCSIVAIAAQFGYPLAYALRANMMELMIFPAFIFIMAVIEWWTAQKWAQKGYLK